MSVLVASVVWGVEVGEVEGLEGAMMDNGSGMDGGDLMGEGERTWARGGGTLLMEVAGDSAETEAGTTAMVATGEEVGSIKSWDGGGMFVEVSDGGGELDWEVAISFTGDATGEGAAFAEAAALLSLLGEVGWVDIFQKPIL